MDATALAEARAIERRMILSYARGNARAALAALLVLDDRLGRITRAARDPLIGQMRLTWWHEALTALDSAPAPAEPVLRGLAAEVLPRGVSGAELARIVDGWEAVLALETDAEAAIAVHATERGAWLFTLGARLLGGEHHALEDAGAGWALAGLDQPRARTLAAARLTSLTDSRWPRALRPLSAMALLARDDLRPGAAPGGARRAGRLILHWIGGR